MQNIKLTPKQETFCRAIVFDGMNYSDAYRKAYNAENMSPKTINERASVLKADSKIATRIDQLRKEADSPRILSVIERKEILTAIAMQIEDTSNRIKAIDILNKMSGEYITKIDADVNADVNINIELSDDD